MEVFGGPSPRCFVDVIIDQIDVQANRISEKVQDITLQEYQVCFDNLVATAEALEEICFFYAKPLPVVVSDVSFFPFPKSLSSQPWLFSSRGVASVHSRCESDGLRLV